MWAKSNIWKPVLGLLKCQHPTWWWINGLNKVWNRFKSGLKVGWNFVTLRPKIAIFIRYNFVDIGYLPIVFCTTSFNSHIQGGRTHWKYTSTEKPAVWNIFPIVAILTLAVVDLIYGIFVSPFFVEVRNACPSAVSHFVITSFVYALQNYVRNNWEQSGGFCKFYMYIFSFHDLFVPLVLILEWHSDAFMA